MHLGNYGAKLIKEKKELVNFYSNKKVLITGHTGFKGGWLTLFLKMMGAQVFGVSHERKNLSSASGFSSVLVDHEVLTDINNVDLYKKDIKNFEPDLVFYLAAQPLVREAFKKPVETFKTNVMGLTNFLNLIKDLKSIKLILTVTSDKVYEQNKNSKKFIETDRLGGVEPYGVSKAMQEMVVKTFYESYFQFSDTKMLSVRAGNVIGGGDWAKDRLIVDIINSLEKQTEMEVRFPHNTRPWQYVIELIYGYLLLAKTFQNDKIGYDTFNFAPEKSFPAEDILRFSKKYWGNRFKYHISNQHHHIYEESKLEISNKKIKNYIKWENDLNLNDTLNNTFDWYKAYLNKNNIFELNKNIVNTFLGINT